MVLYDSCPVCGQKDIYRVLSTEDFTVSHERFEIWECRDCTLRFTQNAPAAGEIGPYYKSETYISHSDTREGFVNKLYHRVREHTLIQKKRLIEKLTPGSSRQNSILDVGSGTGAFLNTMKQSGWKVTGLEPDENAKRKAKELYQLSLGSSENLFSLPAESLDAITMWHVLEHVHQLHAYLKQLRKILKPGGNLFIAVPNYTSFDQHIYKEYWAAYDVPRHLYHFSPWAMNKLLSLHEMQLALRKPMWFDSFYVCMLSEQYKSGRSNFIKAILNGGVSNLKAYVDTGKCSSVIYVAH